MAGGNAPLEGIRVLDSGRHQAGPRCAQVLARLGAEVIKIERLEGEETRQYGPWSKDHLRQENKEVIGEAVVAVLANMTMQEGIKHFTKHDITAAPVNTVAQATADPHPWERRVMVEVPDPIAGTIPVSGDYWHFGRSEVVVGSTPTVGQHTDKLLGDLLHYTPEQLSELREARVIA